MAGELQIVSRVYDLILWTLNHTSKFPRDHRFTLGTRLEDTLYGLLDDVLEAKLTQQKGDILRRAALRLEKIRFQFRLAKDLHILALSSHRHACGLVDDIGRQVAEMVQLHFVKRGCSSRQILVDYPRRMAMPKTT